MDPVTVILNESCKPRTPLSGQQAQFVVRLLPNAWDKL